MNGTAQTDPAAGLSVRAYNRRRPIVKTSLDDRELAALNEVEDYYAPSAIVRLVTTYFRSGPGAGLHVGHGQYFDFDHVVSRLLRVRGLATSYASQVYGGGKGLDLHDTYVSSIGEGIERVLGSFAFLDWMQRVRVGSVKELRQQGLTCLGPEDVPIFSEQQYADPHFQFERWDEDDPLGWIPGRRLFSGDEVWVPAQLVLFIYYRDASEPLIGLAPSGGLSSHISEDRAQFHAICELIERDAVNLRWHGRVPLDRVVLDVPPRDRQVRKSLEALRDNIAEPGFFLQNLDFMSFPVITAIQFDRWLDRLSYNAGGGVGASPDDALRSALGEYCQSERSLRICQVTDNWQFASAFDALFGIAEDATNADFTRFVQAITYYGYRSHAEASRWYFEDGGEVPLSELYARIDADEPDPRVRLRKALENRGMDPIMFDFTPKGLSTTRVIKAFLPELSQPYPPQSPALGHPRYLEIPVEAGKRSEPLESGELLAEPLPYP